MISVGTYCTRTEADIPGKKGGKPVTLPPGTKLQIERPGADSGMEGPRATILSGPHKGKNFDLPESVLPLLAREE